MRDHLAQLDFAPGLWNDLVLHLHLLEMDPNGRSAHVDFRSLPPTRSASLAARWTSTANQPQERHTGRDGADFQLKFAEHGRKLAAMTLFPHRHPPVPGAAALLWQPKCQPPGGPAGPEAHPPPAVCRWGADGVPALLAQALLPAALPVQR